jgi:hypothetical protein
MSPKARFSRSIAGRERIIDVHHSQLTDRADVFVDGAMVPVKKVRRAFSGLWRFQFAIDGEPLEVRMRYGLVEPVFELGTAGEAVEGKKLGWKAYAATGAFTLLMLGSLRPPPPLALGLFFVCTFGVGALISFVYGRN